MAQQQGLSFDKAKSMADAGIDINNQEAVRRFLQDYSQQQPVTASQAAKAAGLPGLNWCAAMIGGVTNRPADPVVQNAPRILPSDHRRLRGHQG
ncbi:hypothetical protein [Aeromonas hydrophila]|uniref:hypothetical protein n=1 Tax=Aeromonas hydrophila TaxID=644 RepID=UPI002441ACEC|nr:hypothetical protein [Aeromonas hydrophila]